MENNNNDNDNKLFDWAELRAGCFFIFMTFFIYLPLLPYFLPTFILGYLAYKRDPYGETHLFGLAMFVGFILFIVINKIFPFQAYIHFLITSCNDSNTIY